MNNNRKYYIGKTSKSVRTRIIQHMTNSKPWTKAKRRCKHEDDRIIGSF